MDSSMLSFTGFMCRVYQYKESLSTHRANLSGPDPEGP